MGVSLREISKRVGCSTFAVYNYTNQLGISVSRSKVTSDLKQKIRLLHRQGLTAVEIQKQVPLCVLTIRKVVREFDSEDQPEIGWVEGHPYQYELVEPFRSRYLEVVEQRKRKHPEAGGHYKTT